MIECRRDYAERTSRIHVILAPLASPSIYDSQALLGRSDLRRGQQALPLDESLLHVKAIDNNIPTKIYYSAVAIASRSTWMPRWRSSTGSSLVCMRSIRSHMWSPRTSSRKPQTSTPALLHLEAQAVLDCPSTQRSGISSGLRSTHLMSSLPL